VEGTDQNRQEELQWYNNMRLPQAPKTPLVGATGLLLRSQQSQDDRFLDVQAVFGLVEDDRRTFGGFPPSRSRDIIWGTKGRGMHSS